MARKQSKKDSVKAQTEELLEGPEEKITEPEPLEEASLDAEPNDGDEGAGPGETEAEEVEEKEEAQPGGIPEIPEHPEVQLKVFIATGGLRWDQMAGFKAHAKRMGLKSMTIQKWREAFQAFMNTPVK